MRQKTLQKGFTLIELLVIISIIAFLVAAVLLALQGSRAKARDAKRVADIKQIITGLDLFFASCGTYPIETTALTLDQTIKLYTGNTSGCGNKTGSDANNGGFGATTGGNVIIGLMQASPNPPDGSCTDSPGSNPYTYTSNDTGSTYTLTFCIGKATGSYTTAGVQTIHP